jgi:hypothetical protein
MIRMSVVCCAALLAVGAPAAVAQTPSQSGYGEAQVLPQATASSSSPAAVRAAATAPAAAPAGAVDANAAQLPFTGLDAGVVALVAALLLGAGFALRRHTTPRWPER